MTTLQGWILIALFGAKLLVDWWALQSFDAFASPPPDVDLEKRLAELGTTDDDARAPDDEAWLNDPNWWKRERR
jgi:hypothetical protein